MKSYITSILSIILLLVVLTSCKLNKNTVVPPVSESVHSQQPKSSMSERAFNNLMNPYNFFTASDDSATYYIGREGLYKVLDNDENPRVLDSFETGSRIAVSDKYIYYVTAGNIRRAEKDGSNIISVFDGMSISQIKCIDGVLYLSIASIQNNETKLVTKSYDISNENELPTIISADTEIPTASGYMVYAKRVNEMLNTYYRKSIGGNDEYEITKAHELVLKTNKLLIFQSDDMGYFTIGYNGENRKPFDLKGLSKTEISTMQFVNYDDEWIYFITQSSDDKVSNLYRVNFEGSELLHFANEVVCGKQVDIADGWVYTYTQDGAVRFKADGTGKVITLN